MQLSRFEQVDCGRLVVRAPAKINLNLLVGQRRRDGYHELDSVVCKITMYDRLELCRRQDGAVTFRCEGADCGPDAGNLALRAAVLLKGETGAAAGVDISLCKRIPPGRGLGGGSSDAAAVLAGLDRLWELNAPAATLANLAPSLGSDVPLFLGPACSRMAGRGERLEPASVHAFVAILYLPACACPTAEVYRAYDALKPTSDVQIDLSELASAPPSAWRGRLTNELALAVRIVRSDLSAQWDRLSAAVPVPVHLTGSGSGLFMLCDDDLEADAVLGRIPEDLRERCLLVRPNAW